MKKLIYGFQGLLLLCIDRALYDESIITIDNEIKAQMKIARKLTTSTTSKKIILNSLKTSNVVYKFGLSNGQLEDFIIKGFKS